MAPESPSPFNNHSPPPPHTPAWAFDNFPALSVTGLPGVEAQ